ncbi:MAG: agmatinase family protein [Crocinitomicaceae bacterium]
MSISQFDPNGVGINNGNLFGFPYTLEEAEIVIIPVPWDATASYGKGTSSGPQAILDASTQLDFYHPKMRNAFDTKVVMTPISAEWKALNDKLCIQAIDYIQFLEEGGKIENAPHFQDILDQINEAQSVLKQHLAEKTTELRQQGKIVAVLGGEHSTPLGLITALAEKESFGILQIDAHADLRDAYEGFEQSHASIMFNALKIPNVKKLVQVGIRDISQMEVDRIESDDKISTFFDWDLKAAQYKGKTWAEQCAEIIAQLPEKVYVSFDIDGLKPFLCPNTGTPVAGGFELEEINFLLFELVQAGKTIIGFDLNEVGVSSDTDWDANVGARALWNLCIATKLSQKK